MVRLDFFYVFPHRQILLPTQPNLPHSGDQEQGRTGRITVRTVAHLPAGADATELVGHAGTAAALAAATWRHVSNRRLGSTTESLRSSLTSL